jgi:hypothetical protein
MPVGDMTPERMCPEHLKVTELKSGGELLLYPEVADGMFPETLITVY